MPTPKIQILSEIVTPEQLAETNDKIESVKQTAEQAQTTANKKIDEEDLTDYVKKTDYPSHNDDNTDNAGVIKIRPDDSWGVGLEVGSIYGKEGYLKIKPAGNGDIANKTNEYRPITSATIDYAVLKALTDCKTTNWTDEEKVSARTLLGAISLDEVNLDNYVKNTDYATYNKYGIVTASGGLGIQFQGVGTLAISKASNSDIDDKVEEYRPLVPCYLDYAVKKALTDCKRTTWENTEKASARTLLGALGADALTNVVTKGAITTKSYYDETYIVLQASTLYIFIHNSGSNNLELILEKGTADEWENAIDCSQETMPSFQAGVVLVPKDISEPLKLKADSQGNLTVYDYDDRTALLMGVTGKTLGVPQVATKQFYYDKSNTGDKANPRVNYGKISVHNKTGSLTVWKIKL